MTNNKSMAVEPTKTQLTVKIENLLADGRILLEGTQPRWIVTKLADEAGYISPIASTGNTSDFDQSGEIERVLFHIAILPETYEYPDIKTGLCRFSTET